MLRTHTCPTVSPVAREARFSFLPVLFGADYLTAAYSDPNRPLIPM